MSNSQSSSVAPEHQSSAMRRHRRELNSWKAAVIKKACGILREEGTQLVEMALTCGILMTMLIGLFEITLAVYSYHYVSDAAREATRWAIVRGHNCVGLTGCGAANADIQTHVRNLGYPGINADNVTTTTTWYTATMNTAVTPNTVVLTSCGTSPVGCNYPSDQVKVVVTYNMPLNIPFVPAATATITSTSAMVISQ